MLNTSGLSLANSPAIQLPLRFFLTAPLFGMAAGLLIAVEGEALLLSRWLPASLAVVHLLVLGFIVMIMCGALLQLLPVLLGASRTASTAQGAAIVAGLAAGTALLASGFYLVDNSLLSAGAILSAFSLAIFVILASRALFSITAKGHNRHIVAMAVFALAVTLLLGLLLAGNRTGWITLATHTAWVNIHLSWGLIGWMVLLLIGVASELLPMFYLSPAYPHRLLRSLPAALLSLLALLAMSLLQEQPLLYSSSRIALVIALSVYIFTSFYSQLQRRRPRRDATLGFWWLGQSAMLLAAFAWLAEMPPGLIGILAIVGAGMSFTSSVLYKIVPFLSWYHLQTRKVMLRRKDIKLPTMQQFISERAARWHLAIHATALLLLTLAVLSTGVAVVRFGGILLAVSALLVWINLLRAHRLFNSTSRML